MATEDSTQTMVEDRITDGKRIAQFFASELTGLEQGPLTHVDVVEADPDAEPTPEGTRGYKIEFRDDVIASVILFPTAAELRLLNNWSWESIDHRDDITIDKSTLTVESVVAVKQAVDVLRATLNSNTS